MADNLDPDARCPTCKHTGFVHYVSGGCSVMNCDCPRAGTWSVGVPTPRKL